MATLGPIVWDFTERTMSFKRHGRDVCWVGVVTPNAPVLRAMTASDSLLDELLASFGDVFAKP